MGLPQTAVSVEQQMILSDQSEEYVLSAVDFETLLMFRIPLRNSHFQSSSHIAGSWKT